MLTKACLCNKHVICAYQLEKKNVLINFLTGIHNRTKDKVYSAKK